MLADWPSHARPRPNAPTARVPFRIRLRDLWREERDRRAEARRAKFAPRQARLEDALRRAEERQARDDRGPHSRPHLEGCARCRSHAENTEVASPWLHDLEAELQRELDGLEQGFDPSSSLESVRARATRSRTAIEQIDLAWAPHWQLPDGTAAPAWA